MTTYFELDWALRLSVQPPTRSVIVLAGALSCAPSGPTAILEGEEIAGVISEEPPAVSIFQLASGPASRPLAVESAQPCWAALEDGPRSLFVSGQGPLVSRLTLDPLCRSYTWAEPLPAAVGQDIELEDVGHLALEPGPGPGRRRLLGVSRGGAAALGDLEARQLLAVIAPGAGAGVPRQVWPVHEAAQVSRSRHGGPPPSDQLGVLVLTRHERKLQWWRRGNQGAALSSVDLLPSQATRFITAMLVCSPLAPDDGDVLILGLADGTLLVWQLPTGRPLGCVTGLSSAAVLALAGSSGLAGQLSVCIGWACGTALLLPLRQLLRMVSQGAES